MDEKKIIEWKKNLDLYLNETCGYCHEKMIIIGSRHVHACKHGLIIIDKDKVIDENKKLKEELTEYKFNDKMNKEVIVRLKSQIDELKYFIDSMNDGVTKDYLKSILASKDST